MIDTYDVYEITLKKGEDLDRRAYALYRSLSVGSRKTKIRYGGKEGYTNFQTHTVASTAIDRLSSRRRELQQESRDRYQYS